MNLVGKVEKACMILVFKGYDTSPIFPKYRSIFDKKTLAEAALIIGVEGYKLTPVSRVVKLGFWKKEDTFQFDQFTPGRERTDLSESHVDINTFVING